jgi:hypothetical protein
VKKIISSNDDLYLVKGKVSVNTTFTTTELKKQWSADTILRNGDTYFVCEKIIEAEFVDL